MLRKYYNTSMQPDTLGGDPEQTCSSSSIPTFGQECSISSDSQDICDECRMLVSEVRESADPFEGPSETSYFARWESVESDHYRRAKVGFRYRSGCPLCQKLVASRIKLEADCGTEQTELRDNGDEIWLQAYCTQMLEYPRETDAVRLILVPQGMQCRDIHPLINFRGSLTLLTKSTHPKLFDPQPISPSFDARTVSSWLNYCMLYHRRCCHSEALPVCGVQVIDCTTLQIKEHNDGTPYVSLSYVWGTSNEACGNVRTIGGHKTLPQLLPRVISDAIKVTKALGYQYLWIDKFCIDQDAADLKHIRIQQMDAIYRNSELTIIAAAGRDESYGLPGVGYRDRSKQFVTNIDGTTVLWNPIDPEQAISQSHWSTRGWTFQEAVLSRRRLVFMEDQVYFQCNTMNCFESIYCPLDRIHVSNRSKTHESIRAGYFGRSQYGMYGKRARDNHTLMESFARYLSNVEDYTMRELRFDEDSLNAFQGIIRQFSQERFAFRDVWGLAYSPSSSEGLGLFIRSLTWMHRPETTARRRTLFPSWSWAGWEGQAEYEILNFVDGRFYNGIHELRFRMTDGESFALEALGGERNYAVLQISAKVVTLGPYAYQGAMDANRPWRIFKHKATLSWSTSSQTDAELAEMFKDTSRWQFVYIGCLTNRAFVMVLELCKNGRTWQRAGMFKVGAWYNKIPKLVGKRVSTFKIE